MAESPLPSRLFTLTPARLRLGRIGASVPTKAELAFQLDHANARDAVWTELETKGLTDALGRPSVEVASHACDRTLYLRRPDLGRAVAENDAAKLECGTYDLAIVIADGLSASAVHAHAASVALALLSRMEGWAVAPVVVARQARVAIGDEIGQRLGAALVCVLIGERPGLSAPDSLGADLTWHPRPGRKDSERNCVFNIRPPRGLSYDEAADTIAAILHVARDARKTGVALKNGTAQAKRIGRSEAE